MNGGQSRIKSDNSLRGLRLFSWTMVYLVCMSACGSIDYQALSARCKHPKSHPQRSYIVTHGEGRTLREARQRASAELARQLSAEVRSEVLVKGVGQNGDTTEQVTEHIEVATHFTHGELIKPVAKCEVCLSDLCKTTVALSRDQAARRLIRDLGPSVQTLQVTTQDLNMQSSLLRFTQAWYQAQATYLHMKPILNQLRVLGRMSPELARSDQIMKDASQKVALRHERLWIAVAPLHLKSSPVPKGILEAVDGQLSRALSSLKLKRLGQTECPQKVVDNPTDVPIDVMKITPQGYVKCSLGLIGPQCRLVLGVVVELCPNKELTQVEWSDLKLVSVHPRDPQRALSKLNQSIIHSDLAGVLKQTLSPFIIF